MQPDFATAQALVHRAEAALKNTLHPDPYIGERDRWSGLYSLLACAVSLSLGVGPVSSSCWCLLKCPIQEHPTHSEFTSKWLLWAPFNDVCVMVRLANKHCKNQMWTWTVSDVDMNTKLSPKRRGTGRLAGYLITHAWLTYGFALSSWIVLA
jgi:hypothetical protein